MTDPIKPASWSYAEAFVAEDDVLAACPRARAEEVGVVAIGPGGGAALRFLASVIEARAVVEIGTGTGVSGLWLLRGMRSDGILTTVDIEAEHQRLARETFTEAGIPTAARPHHRRRRARRAPPAHRRPLRPRLLRRRQGGVRRLPQGGAAAAAPRRRGGLRQRAVARPGRRPVGQRDEETLAIRELVREVGADDSLVPVLLPVGDGLLLAKKEWTPESE